MMNVIAIFDVGKTNKKLFLFDEQYRIIVERTCLLAETEDEDGEPCEDLRALHAWMMEGLATLKELTRQDDLSIRAINYSAYGASLVHIGTDDQPVTPLYNYLKPYPRALQDRFYAKYGGEMTFSMMTASPVLGSLNAGMQLYRIREERPDLFDQIKYSLHLPQYLSWVITGTPCSDITSIGCHTNLWNFPQHHYHEWVYREGIIEKLRPILPSDSLLPVKSDCLLMQTWQGGEHAALCGSGIGLHDSSAAMIPYLESFSEPFLLISTGTWCISMNPFDDSPLTVEELQKDCLCYMSFRGTPVKAARIFAGRMHEEGVQRLSEHFHKTREYYHSVTFDPALVARLNGRAGTTGLAETTRGERGSGEANAADFQTYEEAYHALIMQIIRDQTASTSLVLRGNVDGGAGGVKRIFVDGGFSRNPIYMRLLAAAFPQVGVFAASVPRASALGAALAIHRHWNRGPLPTDLVELKAYS